MKKEEIFRINEFNSEQANKQIMHATNIFWITYLADLDNIIQNFRNELTKAKKLTNFFAKFLFIIGVIFLITALILAFSPNDGFNNLETILGSLGFGGVSATSYISFLLLKPANKIQDANSDATQAEMIIHNWGIGLSLYLKAMKSDDPKSLKEAAENIGDLTSKSVQLIEKHYENKK
jgi:uncharacterized membrane protein YtjA (UPF0391 family)